MAVIEPSNIQQSAAALARATECAYIMKRTHLCLGLLLGLNSVSLLAAEGPDSPETFHGDSIDVGALAEQFFGLGIDPYARKPGATLDAGDEEGVEESDFQRKLRSLLKKS